MLHPWVKKAAIITISAAITLCLLFGCLSIAGSAMHMLTGQQLPGPFARWSLSLTPCVLVAVLYARWRTRRTQRQSKPNKAQSLTGPQGGATPPQPQPNQPPTLAELRKSLKNQ